MHYSRTFNYILISAFCWLKFRNRPLALEMTNKLPRRNSYRVFIIELYKLNQQTLISGKFLTAQRTKYSYVDADEHCSVGRYDTVCIGTHRALV